MRDMSRIERGSTRAVILKESSVVLIKRVRDGVEYWVFPGGGVEADETDEQALLRENLEELDVEVRVERHWLTLNVRGTEQRFYLCHLVSGHIGTGRGPEYTSESYSDRGTYAPQLVSLNLIRLLNILPEEAKAALIELSDARTEGAA